MTGAPDPALAARIAEAYRTALQHQQAGRLAEAEAIYRQILGADPGHADALNQMGILAYQVGRPDVAEDMFARAVAANPRQATFHYHLGLVRQDQGKLDEAIGAYRQAITLKAAYPLAHNNLGVALRTQGKMDAAVASFERATALKPDFAEAHFNLGLALQAQGKDGRAEACYRRALVLNPDYAGAHTHLGVLAMQHGKPEEAEIAFGRATALAPDDPDAFLHLGLARLTLGDTTGAAKAYRQATVLKPENADTFAKLGYIGMISGRFAEGLADYERALALAPGQADAHNNVGSALNVLGRLDEAVTAFENALALKPDYPEAFYNLAIALQAQDRLDEAEAAYGRALDLNPAYPEAHNNLGDLLQMRGRLEEAAASYGRAIAVKPDHASAHSNLGTALQEQGRRREALASFDRAQALRPDLARGGSARLMALHYGQELSAPDLLAEHAAWGDLHSAGLAPPPPAIDRDSDRRLRVGYVSGDFRAHSVAYFLEPLLRAHDRAVVEVFCYAEVARPDPVTGRLRALADHWRPTLGLSDEALADQVRADRIDILIDLAGHTDRNRLLAFARKPAPVQATWLGYPNTTGLAAMDYRLVDAVTDPPGVAEAWARETLIRMEDGFLCYAPPEESPEPSPRPSAGGVVFGSFNNPAKLSDQTVATWARLLHRVPNSRLLLKGRPFADAGAKALLEARFAEQGIDASRVEIMGWLAGTGSHLGAYAGVDIGLDPFPYNGTTTTCEALWMGVPVVALMGDRHAGRVGASLLSQIGLTELIAADEDAYVEIAAGLAAAPDRLAEFRRTLRPRLQASPLMDAPGFARRFEQALRRMWLDG